MAAILEMVATLDFLSERCFFLTKLLTFNDHNNFEFNDIAWWLLMQKCVQFAAAILENSRHFEA